MKNAPVSPVGLNQTSKVWGPFTVIVAILLCMSTPKAIWPAPAATTRPASEAIAIDQHHMLPADLYSDRPAGMKIDAVVIHFISAVEIDARKAYDFDTIVGLFKPAPAQQRAATSAHYLLDRSGKIFLLVPEIQRAWHAGASKMPPPDNREKVNDFSIGIELVMTARDHPTDEQYESLARLICDLKTRYAGLKLDNIVGHDTVRAGWNSAHPDKTAFAKTDPGPLFHWTRLVRRLAELTFR